MKNIDFQSVFLFTIKLCGGYDTPIDWIENLYLKSIINSFVRVCPNLDEKLENSIRDKIVNDLHTNKNTEIYPLIQDKVIQIKAEARTNILEGNKGRIDIDFFMSGLEFTIECKLLKFADKKYLEEGLKRFIDLKYAETDDYAGMIGFIIKGEPEKIVKNLKKKVKVFHPAPDMEDALSKTCAQHNLSFQSKHIRTNNTEIHIFHIFFDAR